MTGQQAPISEPQSPSQGSTPTITLVAFILGILALVLGCFTGIPAIICGHIALSKHKLNPALQGRGLALAGLVLGYVITLLVIIVPIVVILMGPGIRGLFGTSAF